jgi:hypothetical protein
MAGGQRLPGIGKYRGQFIDLSSLRAAPERPPAGKTRLYVKSDKSLAVLKDDGTEQSLGGSVDETGLSFTDITTANSSTSKHGLLPKLDNNAAHYLDGTGAWSTPSGGGGGGTVHEDFWTAPDSAGTYDEEFASTADTLPTNWAWTTQPTGSNSWNLNSMWKRCLCITRAASDTTTFDLRRTSMTPGAIDISFAWYMDLGLGYWNNNSETIETIFFDSTLSEGFGIKMTKVSALTFVSRSYTGGAGSDVSAENASNNDTRGGLVCEVSRKTSDNTWRARVSADGRTWIHLNGPSTRSVTIDRMRIQFTSAGNNGVTRAIWGPFRSRASLLPWAPR